MMSGVLEDDHRRLAGLDVELRPVVVHLVRHGPDHHDLHANLRELSLDRLGGLGRQQVGQVVA